MKKMVFFILFSYPITAMERNNIQQTITEYKNYDPTKHPLYKSQYVDDFHKKQWQIKKPKIIESVEQKGIAIINKPEYGTTGHTPLCHAIEGNDFGFVQFLLENGADINQKIKNAHSSRPIFFAQTLEMVKFLQQNGANLNHKNKGLLFSSNAVNFLHWAMSSCINDDDRIPPYALSQNFDLQSLSQNGGNLWHTLMHLPISFSSHQTLMDRARLLTTFAIDPYAKNHIGKSAVDMINDEIIDNLKSTAEKSAVESPFFCWKDQNIKINNLLQLLTLIVESTAQKTIRS